MASHQPDEREQNRSLRILLSAYAVSQLGNWLFRTGVVYRAYNQNHGSNTLLTAAIVLVYLPILFGSRLLAPLADRHDTRRTLVGLDALRAIVLLLLLVAIQLSSGLTSAATIGVMAFLSLLTPFFTASQTAYLRRVLDTERIPAALASVSRVDWSTFVIGTAAAPLLLQVSNLPTLIVLDIATFVVSGLLLFQLRPAPVTAAGQKAAGKIAGASRLAAGSRWLLTAVFLLNAGAGLINVYPNFVARNFLGGGATWLSIINLANGVGGVVGATLAGRLRKRGGILPGVLAAAAVACALGCMTLVTIGWAAALASSVMLMAGQVFAVLFQARVLQNEPVEVAGRVSGHFTLGTFAGVTTSILLFKGLTAGADLRASFTLLLLIGAAAALAATAVGLVAMRRFGFQAEEAASGTPEPEPEPEEPAASESDVADLANVADEPDPVAVIRGVGRAFATGVAVATTVSAGSPHATTVNSFTTVSLDPGLVLICVKRGSRLDAMLEVNSPLAITILSDAQESAARHFADDGRPQGERQFDGHPWHPAPASGAPLLDDGMAWLDCQVHSVLPAGDHSVVLARALSLSAPESGPTGPLLFFGGKFGTMAGRAVLQEVRA